MALTYPLEQIRTQQQTESSGKGKRNLYQGMAAVVETVALSNFLYFYCAQYSKRLLEQRSSPIATALASSTVAAAVNVVLTEPLWKANTYLKTLDPKKNSSTNEKNLVSVIISLAKRDGVLNLWSGTGVSLWLISNPIIQFSVYEFLKKKSGSSLTAFRAFLLGAISKAIATIITYPLQVAQTRLRIQRQVGMLFVLRQLYTEKAFFKGCSAKLAQTVLTAAFMFSFYERIVALLFRSLRD